MGKVLGIDLGTTNSCCAVYMGSEPVVITNSEGDRITPSVVAIGQSGERLIGEPAKRQAVVNPMQTFHSVKRFTGRKYSSPFIKANLGRFTFRVNERENGDCCFPLFNKVYSPEELTAMILSKLRREAEEFIGETIEEAVIAVPAHFDDRQRSATRDAGTIAGLNVLKIMNEPTAAALAYGLQSRHSGVVAVYDLGGGTFDISIMRCQQGEFTVLATSGSAFLGGDDFDQRVIAWMVEQFEKAKGLRIADDPTTRQRLRNAAETAKRELSTAQSARITIPFFMIGPEGPLHLELELLRAQFETLVGDLVEGTLPACRQALQDAGLKPENVDEVILVGGQSRSPIVERRVTEFFGKPPLHTVNPAEAVAMGAAIVAGMAHGEVEQVKFRDVTPLSLGVETLGGLFNRVIPRNTPLPASAKKAYTTTEDYQMVIRVDVLQGERELSADNRHLATLELAGIRPALRGVATIEVSFDIDTDGIVHVTARDEDTGREQSVRISNLGGLGQDQVDRMVEEAERYYQEDNQRRELVRVKNSALNLVYSANRVLTETGGSIEPVAEEKVRTRVEALKGVVETARATSEIEQSMEELLMALKDLEYMDPTPELSSPNP